VGLLADCRTAIKQVYGSSAILAQLCFAQAVLESDLDGKPSHLATHYNNLFGIKSTERYYKHISLPTIECYPRECAIMRADFVVFDSIKDCIMAHKALISRPRYTPVREAETFEDACVAIWECGYATDPTYPKQLINRYKAVGGL